MGYIQVLFIPLSREFPLGIIFLHPEVFALLFLAIWVCQKLCPLKSQANKTGDFCLHLVNLCLADWEVISG